MHIYIRRVRLNWYFRDEPNPFCSEQPSFFLSHPEVRQHATLT